MKKKYKFNEILAHKLEKLLRERVNVIILLVNTIIIITIFLSVFRRTSVVLYLFCFCFIHIAQFKFFYCFSNRKKNTKIKKTMYARRNQKSAAQLQFPLHIELNNVLFILFF